MGEGQLTRREMMRQGGAAVGAASLLGTAGCLDSIPFIGGAKYKSWLPAPDVLGDGDHYSFQYINLKQVANNEDEFSDETVDGFSNIEQLWSPIDLDWDEANWVLAFQGSYVVNAGYDQDSVAGDLEDEDFSDDTDHEGYTIYLGPNERRAFAIDGSNIVLVGGEDPVDNAEAVIDTDNGNEDRYVDESDDMNTLVGALGSGTTVSGRTMEEPSEENVESGRFENMVAGGQSTSVNGSTSNGKYVVVYEDSSDVDTGDLEDWVEASQDNDGQFADWEDLNYNSNGRKGVIKASIDTDEL